MVRRQIRPLLKIADKAGSHSRRPKENTAFPALIVFIVFLSSAARLDTANHSGYSELLCKNLPSGYAASMTAFLKSKINTLNKYSAFAETSASVSRRLALRGDGGRNKLSPGVNFPFPKNHILFTKNGGREKRRRRRRRLRAEWFDLSGGKIRDGGKGHLLP